MVCQQLGVGDEDWCYYCSLVQEEEGAEDNNCPAEIPA